MRGSAGFTAAVVFKHHNERFRHPSSLAEFVIGFRFARTEGLSFLDDGERLP
jgi:hypothetical protein